MKTSNNFHTRIVNKPNRNWLISADESLFVYSTFGALKDGTDEIFRCQLILGTFPFFFSGGQVADI